MPNIALPNRGTRVGDEQNRKQNKSVNQKISKLDQLRRRHPLGQCNLALGSGDTDRSARPGGRPSPGPTGQDGASTALQNLTAVDPVAELFEKLAGPRLHDLRHHLGSGLIAAGCDPLTVARALGHRDASTTLRVYSHLWPSADDRTRRAASGLMSDPVADSARAGEGG
ncbi:MAG TPA: tyrosine-type recombinase/integrase [Pseudonocardia sp.]